ncbi:hypothetical protein [Fodinicola feengrottensis]|nr:hypothetical protein [Fodinicola feengrottensis]
MTGRIRPVRRIAAATGASLIDSGLVPATRKISGSPAVLPPTL